MVKDVNMKEESVTCRLEVLQPVLKGPCLHRPENEPKPVHKVGFVREKGKATARAVQQSLETSSSLLR
jgi:hypothetical protein